MPGPFDAVTLPPFLAQAAGAAAGGNPNQALWTYAPMVVVIGLWFYVLLIRPQQKQEQQRRSMIDALKKNDRVLTSAGIYGTVHSVDGTEDRVVLKIDDDKGVRVAFSKASIVKVLDGPASKDKAVAESVKGAGSA